MIDFIDHDTNKIIRISLDETSCDTCSSSSFALDKQYGRLADRVRGNKNYTRLCSRIDMTQLIRSNTTIDDLTSYKFASYFSSSLYDAIISAPLTCALQTLRLKAHEALILMHVMGEALRFSLLVDSPSQKDLLREYYFARRADLESCFGQIAEMAGAMKDKRLMAAAGDFASEARKAVEKATPVIELP